MKHIFLFLNLVLLGFTGFSQVVTADIGYSNNAFTNASGGPVDANNFSINQVARLQVAFSNNSFDSPAPAGRFTLVIGLGSGFELNPTYNLATAPFSNYFNFSYAVVLGQGVITGRCIAPVPAFFTGLLYFEVKATTGGPSTASFNILIDNSAGAPILIDDNPLNNSGLNPYFVNPTTILPVTFAGLSASIKDCDANISWNVKGELNVSRYEVEVSKDGTTYSKAAEVSSRNLDKYSINIPLTEQLKSPVLYFRIKSVDKDGKSAYSEVRQVKGQCEQSRNLKLSLYPNPVPGNAVTITALEGSFNGKYIALLIDKGGKVYQNKELELNNVSQFKFSLGNIAPGSYSIKLVPQDKTASAVLEFTKL